MSEKSFGFKVRLGFNNAGDIMSVLNLTSSKLTRALETGDITPEHNLTEVEITPSDDFGYTIMFHFDNEPSIENILAKQLGLLPVYARRNSN